MPPKRRGRSAGQRRAASAARRGASASRGRRGRTSGPSSTTKSRAIARRDSTIAQRQIDNERALKKHGIIVVDTTSSADQSRRVRGEQGFIASQALAFERAGKSAELEKKIADASRRQGEAVTKERLGAPFSSEPKNPSQDVSKVMGAKIAREATEEAIEAAYGRVRSKAGGKQKRDDKGRFA